MSTDIIKNAFIAGELSPTLYGRSDLTKYDLGVAEAKNFFVDYRGGLSTRPGTRFMEYIKDDDKVVRIVPFEFNPDEEDTHIILFGDDYIRFLQGGNYILEASQSCTVSTATPAVVTATTHGLSTGNWIKVSGVAYSITVVDPNTFEIYSVPDGAAIDGTTVSFTAFSPVYEIVSPYASTDLEGLSFNQYRDQVTITSLSFPSKKLVRAAATSWSISDITISEFAEGPTVSGESLSDAGTAQTVFAVTKVLANGTESVAGPPYRLDNAVNYPQTEGSVSITWAAESDAVFYNVYRSIVAGGTTAQALSLGSELGYLGKTYGTKFTDPNIVPDFGRVSPNNYNPFAPGAITSVTVTNGGTGYTSPPTISASGGGSNFSARAILNDSGAVVRVIILNGGSDYTSPTVSASGGGGSGATFTAVARETTGTYPSLSAVFQQRRVYAASDNFPITIWGSQINRFDNFNSSDLVLASESYEFDLDTAAISPIRHLLTTRGGLLAMTQDNVWLVKGDGENETVTPVSVLADPQTYTGISTLDPIRIGPNILYTEGKGYAVRSLSYNEVSRVYAGIDRSILSTHLFGLSKTIVSWAYQESPYKVVWGCRADGALLSFTTVEEEDVFAWTPCETQGKFLKTVKIREENQDRVYFVVERLINGRWTKFIERLDLRDFTNVEDAWCVDCGLSLDATYPAGTVTVYRDASDNYTAEISTGSWGSVVGDVLRLGEGIFNVDAVASGTATLTLRKEPTNWVPETDRAYTYPVESGSWTLDTPVTAISGLDHLEGETVSILADGNVSPRQVVTSGAITLPNAATRVIIGLRYTCKAKTLPITVPQAGIEAKRKRIVAVAVRVTKTRGLQVGDDYERLYEFPERSSEAWGSPVELQEGIQQMPIGTTWTEEGQTAFQTQEPLPVTLLSLVQDLEVGDDPN